MGDKRMAELGLAEGWQDASARLLECGQ